MFDIGWTEMLVVAIIAIVFVGPKELPGMLRTFGKVIKKVRGMAGEFQTQFDDAIKEAELDGLKDTINDVRSLDPAKAIKDKLNPLKADLEKPVEEKPVKKQTPQEIEAEIAENYAKAQKQSIEANTKSTGTNAVPGFSSEPDPVETPPKKVAKAKTAKSKAAKPQKAVASKKSAAKKATATAKTAKPVARKPKKQAAGNA